MLGRAGDFTTWQFGMSFGLIHGALTLFSILVVSNPFVACHVYGPFYSSWRTGLMENSQCQLVRHHLVIWYTILNQWCVFRLSGVWGSNSSNMTICFLWYWACDSPLASAVMVAFVLISWLTWLDSFLNAFHFSLLISSFAFFCISFASRQSFGSTSLKVCPYFSVHCS